MDRLKTIAVFCLAVMVALVMVAGASPAMAQCGFAANSCGSQVACGASVSPSLDVNLPCAVQAASAVAACRSAGGRFFACAIEGFGTYLSCNGGLRQQRRAVRLRNRQLAALNYTRRNPDVRCR